MIMISMPRLKVRDYASLINKDIDTPEALDFENFKEVSNRKAIKESKIFCSVKYTGID